MIVRGHELTALGIYAGIGSPLVGASRMGFRVIGNIENRPYYWIQDEGGRNTFRDNFDGAWMVKSLSEVDINKLPKITVMAGHPKCGAYSNLVNLKSDDRKELGKKKSEALIETLRAVRKIKPFFFFIDNLPKFLLANPIDLFIDALPDYNIDVAFVCNAGYGNCQWNRNRLFVIASRKELGYEFVPDESKERFTLRDIISDLPQPQPWDENNHVKHTLMGSCKGGYRLLHEGPMTWSEARKYFRDKTDKKPMHYFQKDSGEVKYHFGYMKCDFDKGCRTLTGITPKIHPVTNLPLSPRERARILGFPDDFRFYGINYEPNGTWRHHNNISLMRQTGNCIPVEFPTFLCRQFIAALKRPTKYRGEYSGKTSIKPNPIVEQAKRQILRRDDENL